MSRQLRLELRSTPSYGRDTFIVSPANETGVRAVDAWPKWHGGCLALVGPEGSGKTHLAQAWASAAKARVLRASDTLTPLDLTRLEGRPVLFEDADRGASDETLFHLINMAGAEGGGLLLTARLAPSAWTADLPDLRSRLNALPVALLPPPDDAILEGCCRNYSVNGA